MLNRTSFGLKRFKKHKIAIASRESTGVLPQSEQAKLPR